MWFPRGSLINCRSYLMKWRSIIEIFPSPFLVCGRVKRERENVCGGAWGTFFSFRIGLQALKGLLE
jgi:hypothetical protein